MTVNIRGIGMTSQRTRDRLVQRLQQAGIHHVEVLEVMRQTPRHIFIDEALASRAYDDTALPIGHGQTISQPYTVARMTEALLAAGAITKVLEVGTGSGYQTAILAQLVEQVYTLERIEALLILARKRFQELKLRNIRSKHGDGLSGWAEYGPFDGIIATAAPMQVPAALKAQLALGGRLIIPVGNGRTQTLKVITRHAEGYSETVLEAVSFVPMCSGEQ